MHAERIPRLKVIDRSSGLTHSCKHARLTITITIREIPDHATFRGKGVNTGLVRQTWGLSLFDQLWPSVISKV